jgi:hypothetical protein
LLGLCEQGLLMSRQQPSQDAAPVGGGPKVLSLENGGGARHDDGGFGERRSVVEGCGAADKAVAADHRDLHGLSFERLTIIVTSLCGR